MRHFHRFASFAVLGSSLLASLPAQPRVIPVKVITRSGSPGYNDCWGYTTPDKRDFALLGDSEGIMLVEATDENNITQKGWWTASRNDWRDFTNYKQYLYSVSEGHRGIRVIDMSNPDRPVDRGYVARSSVTHAHNISVDPDSGKLYLSGTNQGVAIFDAKANPLNPRFVGTWRTEYVHDICARRGKAYFAAGSSGYVRILDATKSPTLSLLGSGLTPGNYTHNCWVSEDDKVLCVTDEIGGGPPHMTIWDISNPRTPVKKGDYIVGTHTVHNVFTIGRTAYMSHYLDGFHVADLADLSKPLRIGHYDTSGQLGLYNGCWGVYPFSDNGLVYASDMQRGLFVFKIITGHMNRYGKGTTGSNGKIPFARFDGSSPRVNATKLTFDVEGLLPNARFVFAYSNAKGNARVLGVDVNIDLSNFWMIHLQADASGTAVIPAPIPNNPQLDRATVYFQIFGEDKGKPLGFSASRGMWAGIGK
ncbi:MAG: choice-of-anchor B family protein [Planctomycetota bacterium]|nr:choice-of-anchor B family protein [Planctomycetota bacterium]